MRRSIFTWISIFWLLSSFLYGQEYIIDVQQFGIEEGLSHRNVHFALQDQRGLMWFGTDYGLNRFDGYNFKAITKKSNGLQSNEVKKALEDKNGLLWLLYGDTKVYGDKCPNIKGIDIFNPLTEEVQSFESFFNGNTKLQSTDFLTFTKKESGELAFLTKDYQLVIYDENGIFSSVNLEKKYNYLTNFHWSKNGNYWMSVKENYVSRQINIITINEAGKEIFNFPIEYYNNNIFSYQTQDNPNEKWIATSGSTLGYQFYEITPNGEIVKNQDEALFKELGVDISGFTNIAGFREHEGKYWLFSNNRFYLYDIKTKAHYIFNREYPDIGFSYQIFIDQQGKTWVSTQFGVFLISLKKNNFTKVFNQEKGLFPIRGLTIDPKNNLWAIQENLPNIWKASLSLDKKKVHHVEPVNGLKTPNRLPFGGIHFALHQSKTRDIIYSPGEHQIIKFNPEDFSKQKYTLSDLTKFPGKIWSIYQDNQGKIWAGTAKGNIVYNEHNNLYYFPLLESSNSQFHIYQFIEAGTSFWVVTEVGLFLIDKTTHQIQERYWSGGEGKYNLPFDKLYHGYQEKDDSFWLGTSGNGLVYFNTKTGDYKQYTKEEGLSNNVIYAVYPDNYQNLWLTSDYGIIRFNKVTRQVNTYLQKNGITHNEFNRISHSQSEDGTLFFGGLNGITVFHPNDFQTDSIISKTPLIISNFYQFVGNENKLLDKTNDLLKSHKITMAPNDPFFRLEFALLAYEDVDKIQYAYQISGIDRDWNYQKENTIRISHLPYGNYNIKLKAQSSDGQWSTKELTIQVAFLKPFYLKTWFLILSAILILTGIFIFNYYWTLQLKRQKNQLEQEVKKRTKTISKQAEELKSLERLKSRFFANVSHELRTPLTLLLVPINKLISRKQKDSEERKLLELAQRNSNKLLKLINEILDLSKLESGKVDLKEEPIHLHSFLTELLAQFHSFALSEYVKLTIDYQINKDLILLLDKDKIEKIIQNYLSNAMKFTPTNGLVQLCVKQTNEQELIFSVTDTGKGIHPEDLPNIFNRFYQSKKTNELEKGGTGIGLAYCKELAELMQGKVWVESELRRGSSFHFQIPMKVLEKEALKINNNLLVFNKTQSNQPNINTSLTEQSTRIRSRKPTILLVEDNKDLQELIKHLLSDTYQVRTANNGKEALETLQSLSFENKAVSIDLIISDLMMPIMDGIELLQILKSDDRYRHLPMIMLTAKANMRAKLKALRIGIDDYILKPFKEEELLVRIKNLLSNTSMRVKISENYEHKNEISSIKEKVHSISKEEAEWLENLEKTVIDNIDRTNYTVEQLSGDLFMNKRSLTRKMKKVVGLTPNKYMIEVRLEKAREVLENRKMSSVKAVSYSIGFLKIEHFSKLFKDRYGIAPSEYF